MSFSTDSEVSVAIPAGSLTVVADGAVSLAALNEPALRSAGSQPAHTASTPPTNLGCCVDIAKDAAGLAFVLGAELPFAVTKYIAVGTTKYFWRRAFRRR